MVYIKVVIALRLVVSLHSATDVEGESCVEQLDFLGVCRRIREFVCNLP